MSIISTSNRQEYLREAKRKSREKYKNNQDRKEQEKAYRKQWRDKNPDKIKQYKETYIINKATKIIAEREQQLKQYQQQVSCEQAEQLELEL